ncbi:DUF2868 domain-containing protein [Noviherbaspirillum aerium]|uniref:DUF2868 domain-containing protein n=1 Tax=Noviherbaspirillum aerium TaxID=2588497 RepID=UPI00124C1AFA|nr:DUF2868 domain-containing protein [Noviherbaspirillum aerium]
MNERMARDVVLMSAIENADQERRVLSDEDRTYASRSANELTQWELADKNASRTPDAQAELFLAKRAEQVLKKVADRHAAFARFTRLPGAWRLLGIGLPVIALLAGFLADRIADPHRVDLLSPPLLIILGWNLLVYLGLLLWPLTRRRQASRGWLPGFATGRLAAPRKLPQPLATALSRFGEEWSRLSMPLSTARFKRIMHLAAACLAAGAILSLYVRGLLTEYRAGWESTFLDASQVHAILSYLFAPATMLLGIEGFSLPDVRALETPQSASPADGARWVHLYAATLLLFVVLPRLLLALAAGWKARRLARRFPLDIGQPYFRRLTAHLGRSQASILRIFPYSFTVDEARDRNLSSIARMLIGEQSRVMLRPSTTYGELPQDTAGDKDIALTAALFNMNATPEKENHGAFLEQLARGGPGASTPFFALIDESSYLERIGGQAGGEQRIRERTALWLQFCEMHKVQAIVINLLDPESRSAEMERGLATLATHATHATSGRAQ